MLRPTGRCFPRRGSQGSGSARLGLSQKDGLPCPLRGRGLERSKAIDRPEGQPCCCPLDGWEPKELDMTPHLITLMFDLSAVTLTANAMPPRDPNDADEEDEEDEKDDTRRTSLPSSENPTKTNSAAGGTFVRLISGCSRTDLPAGIGQCEASGDLVVMILARNRAGRCIVHCYPNRIWCRNQREPD